MLKRWKGFLSGIICTFAVMVLAVTVFAEATSIDISVYFNNIKIIYNGIEIEMSGKIVEWDEFSNTVIIYDTEIDKLWDTLIEVPDNYTGLSIYWRYIDDDTMEKVDSFIAKYGADVLFKGLKSPNVYSQYYCMNRLVEYYNYDEIRINAINEITPFLSSSNDTLRQGAEFAISVLSKEFDNPYIVHVATDVKIFALFNDYSDYGSYNELWIIKNDELSKLYSFTGSSQYFDTTNPMKLSPDNNRLAVQTCSRRSSSINIIDINTGEVSPEIMVLAVEMVASDNKDYNNTYPDGRYCWCGGLEWLDSDTVEFEADLSYDFMEIIENVIIKYNVSDNSLVYTNQ